MRLELDHHSPQAWTRSERQWLAGILVLAAALRIWAAVVSPAIVKDGQRYLTQAEQLADNPQKTIREGGELPLFPAMTCAVYLAMRRFSDAGDPYVLAAAGRVCCIVAGVWLVFMVHVLSRSVFDRRTALLAAAMAAMMDQFVLYSADVIADPPFMAVYFTGAWVVLWACRRPRAWRFLLVGVAAALAYLTRREGVLLIGGVGVLLLLVRGYGWRRRMVHGGSAALGYLLLAGPYMLMIGGFSPTADNNLGPLWSWFKSLASWSGGGSVPVVLAGVSQPLERCGVFLMRFLEDWARCLRYVLGATFVLSFVLPQRRRAARLPAVWLAILAGLHFSALAVFYMIQQVVSIRYVMPIVALSLPWSAEGFRRLVHLLAAWMRRGYPLAEQHLQVHYRRLLGIGVGVLAAVFLPYVYRGNQGDPRWAVQAGEWVAAHTPPNARLLVTDPRVGFYGQRTAVWLEQPGPGDTPFPSPRQLLLRARAGKYGYLVADLKRLREVRNGRRLLDLVEGSPGIERLAPPDDVVARALKEGGNVYLIYRLRP